MLLLSPDCSLSNSMPPWTCLWKAGPHYDVMTPHPKAWQLPTPLRQVPGAFTSGGNTVSLTGLIGTDSSPPQGAVTGD